MMEMEAIALQAGDEFTTDDGQTWHTVKTAHKANRGRKVVVVDEVGKEHIFDADKLLVVKL